MTKFEEYMDWQPIETAPRDGTVIIGQEAGTVAGTCLMFAAAIHFRRGIWMREHGGGFSVTCDPVRWIPMPRGGVPLGWAEPHRREAIFEDRDQLIDRARLIGRLRDVADKLDGKRSPA